MFYYILFFSLKSLQKKIFTINDVIDGINEKLIKRHPKVFNQSKFQNDVKMNKIGKKKNKKTKIEDQGLMGVRKFYLQYYQHKGFKKSFNRRF